MMKVPKLSLGCVDEHLPVPSTIFGKIQSPYRKSMEAAFVSMPILYRPRTRGNTFSVRGACPRMALVGKWRMKMTDAEPVSTSELTSAEKTRRALSKDKPMVKFRRESEDNENAPFEYTSGVKEGGLDIWLITGVLVILVPLAVFAWGVQSGVIDVNPR